MGWYDYDGTYYADGGGESGDWWDPWGDSSGAGQVGSPGSEWAGDSGSPYTDEYWDDIYQGGGIIDPNNPTPTFDVTGYGDDSDYEGFNNAPPGSSPEQYGGGGGGGGATGTGYIPPNFDVTGYGDDADYNFPIVPSPVDPIPSPVPDTLDPPNYPPVDPYGDMTDTPIFRGGVTRINPIEPIPSPSPTTLTPPVYTPMTPPIGREYSGGYTPRPPIRELYAPTQQPPKTPTPAPAPAPAPANKKADVKQTNIVSESFSNNMPGIASGSPAGNPETFDPQYIPQSQRTDATIGQAGPTENPYDYGEADSWKYTGPDAGARGTIAGNDRISGDQPDQKFISFKPKQQGPGVLRSIAGGIAGLAGLDISSPKALGQSVLGLTGANRYLDMINQQKKKKNPYAPF